MSSHPPLADLTQAAATTLDHPVELIPIHETGRTQVPEVQAQGQPSAVVLKRYLTPAYRNWLGPLAPEAGAWLNMLHTQAPLRPDAVPLPTALERRFRAALAQASRGLSDAVVARLSTGAPRYRSLTVQPE